MKIDSLDSDGSQLKITFENYNDAIILGSQMYGLGKARATQVRFLANAALTEEHGSWPMVYSLGAPGLTELTSRLEKTLSLPHEARSSLLEDVDPTYVHAVADLLLHFVETS